MILALKINIGSYGMVFGLIATNAYLKWDFSYTFSIERFGARRDGRFAALLVALLLLKLHRQVWSVLGKGQVMELSVDRGLLRAVDLRNRQLGQNRAGALEGIDILHTCDEVACYHD